MNPEGWTTSTAEQLCSQISVGIVVKPSQYYVGEKEGVRTFRSANVGEGFVRNSEWVYISPEGHAKNRKSVLKANDILIVRTGFPGTACLLPREYEGSNCIDIIFARPDQRRVIPAFLCAFTNSEYGKKQILDGSGGLAQKHFNAGAYKKLKVPVPPLDEQRRIVDILITWDRAIETVEDMIANASCEKKALMQALLTSRIRLPGFAGDWHWHKLSDVFSRVRDRNDVGDTNVLTISAQHGLISQTEYFNKIVASDDVRGYTLLRRGDFAYNKSYSDGYPFGAFKPLERYDRGIVSSLYICFRLTSPSHDHDFMRHYFEAGLFNREVAAIAQEGARNHGLLNVGIVDFFDTSLHTPGYDEQVAIAAVINDAERRERSLLAQRDALHEERRALMQQLLTGKRRVTPSETEAA
jgi:type I restriction enzyme S subunit